MRFRYLNLNFRVKSNSFLKIEKKSGGIQISEFHLNFPLCWPTSLALSPCDGGQLELRTSKFEQGLQGVDFLPPSFH
jgi:hypothetical protein